ncbi:mitochondrial inner membrane protease subunit 2 isoform X1 [Phyllopteryx taeniolatus]|uniref:mitochondrial inner membrane protease subunit 2 isoform X1 n=1 Tax=Phyllopteryx taeniolatus TaxID=161469 RepID=UPI002AD493C2|nr:mitochondrial inner membrane protease subunit 2 isoform X1 [Phyllopteryx taeniolatus]XP_061630949.1 mitochondrial inner membrane protease subunit 2 isoform X1 [Phyllopteryx taeniolatus]
MAQGGTRGRRYLRAFVSGFFVAVPVTVTVLDRLAYVARVEGSSMQPFLNPEGASEGDVVLLNRWSVRKYHVQRGDIVSVMSPRNPEQKIIKRVIALEGDFIRTLSYKKRHVRVPDGHVWIEGDHHGHSLDSNTFGPVRRGVGGSPPRPRVAHRLAAGPLAAHPSRSPAEPSAAVYRGRRRPVNATRVHVYLERLLLAGGCAVTLTAKYSAFGMNGNCDEAT